MRGVARNPLRLRFWRWASLEVPVQQRGRPGDGTRFQGSLPGGKKSLERKTVGVPRQREVGEFESGKPGVPSVSVRGADFQWVWGFSPRPGVAERARGKETARQCEVGFVFCTVLLFGGIIGRHGFEQRGCSSAVSCGR